MMPTFLVNYIYIVISPYIPNYKSSQKTLLSFPFHNIFQVKFLRCSRYYI